jgi:hypothetical protein
MAEQQKMSSFASRFGAQVAAANREHKDKPIDTGNRRLPAGINNGVAKLSAMYTKEYVDDKAGMKGQTFFRASAIVVQPTEHKGEKVAGLITQVIIPLCPIPEKGQRGAKSFSDQWFEFQNLFKLLGINPPNEQGTDEAAGLRIQAYYFAAMKALTDPARQQTNPVYISFSTRGWTPPATPMQPNPTEMVFESWHGLADYKVTHNPAAAVRDNTQPDAHTPPPSMGADGLPNVPAKGETTLVEEVAFLLDTINADNQDSAPAAERLQELARENGWSQDAINEAPDWNAVAQMALPVPQVDPETNGVPDVGAKYRFAKRGVNGERLCDANGKPFDPVEVTVATVNEDAGTCTVKGRDGKVMTNLRTKKPVEVKFEWLE